MKFSNYALLAQRTQKKFDKKGNIFHAWLGIHTEMGELMDIYKKKFAYAKDIDIPNLKEEIGDTFWYFAIWANEFMTVAQYQSRVDNYKSLVAKNGDLTNICKRIAGMIRKADTMQANPENIKDLIYDFIDFCVMVGIDYEECLQKNIDKLKVRYPEFFNEQDAIVRKLTAERNVLEA